MIQIMTLLLIFPVIAITSITYAADFEKLAARGNELYAKGYQDQAAKLWKQALESFEHGKKPEPYLDTSIYLANVYQQNGYHKRALSLLLDALPCHCHRYRLSS